MLYSQLPLLCVQSCAPRSFVLFSFFVTTLASFAPLWTPPGGRNFIPSCQPAEVIFRNIGTVQFSVDCEGARLAMVHLGEVVRAPKAVSENVCFALPACASRLSRGCTHAQDGVDPLVAHSYLRALMGPFHVNRCYAVAMVGPQGHVFVLLVALIVYALYGCAGQASQARCRKSSA